MADSPRKITAEEAARRVARSLTDAGYQAFFAGGCVRDRLFGIEPEDYDIATGATPEQVQEVFPRARGVGAAFGVMLVPNGGRHVEVATFRSDGPYEDARRPSHVSFTSPEVDAQRRDFTINGLFQDPVSDAIIDYVDGQADIAQRVLRAIGDPVARFAEDHLRMLRAARFAARFELEIEPATAAAIASGTKGLAGVSRERVGQELRRMLGERHRSVAVGIMERLGMDVAVLGAGNTGDRTRLEGLPDTCDWIDALAAWLLDRGEGEESVDTVDRMTAMLMLSNHERSELQDLFRIRQVLLREWKSMSIAARKRLAAGEVFDRALMLVAIEAPDLAADVIVDYEQLRAEGLAPTAFLNGNDLLAAGFLAGPQLGKILDRVYDAQLDGEITNSEDALKLARTL
ncbi:MAG: CCA tRNA nucleotidyltransferase, partial [Phycisphaerales bacterium]|nr:CCA tRNA nucleotidyltransferase [Phycisphaerales bacterium]